MMKIIIGDFVIWEKDDSGDISYRYLDDKVSILSNKNVPIINRNAKVIQQRYLEGLDRIVDTVIRIELPSSQENDETEE